jgi:hypothetical protein
MAGVSFGMLGVASIGFTGISGLPFQHDHFEDKLGKIGMAVTTEFLAL